MALAVSERQVPVGAGERRCLLDRGKTLCRAVDGTQDLGDMVASARAVSPGWGCASLAAVMATG